MSNILPCPFCGGQPWFSGDAARWKDENRYVELNLECCAIMNQTIGWQRAREMTVAERTNELKIRLIEIWNKRDNNATS